MIKYTQECLINKLSISRLNDISFLLGAGCSISSGCMAAGKLVTEFKKIVPMTYLCSSLFLWVLLRKYS